MRAHALRLPLLLAFVPSLAARQPAAGLEWTEAKRTAAAAVDQRAELLDDAARKIWGWAELALKETRSSKLLADLLESEGFRVERGISDMPTAFVATYGTGKPVVALLAEFDALPGLSQKAVDHVDPVTAGACGHGCGHNLFGAGSVGAGLALMRTMEASGIAGTLRVYGTPAEEHGIGKVFLVRDGWFQDVAACLSWHPSDEYQVSMQPSKALRSFEITFYGRSAHAAAAPWKGVSALDALEAFTTGVNLLREHVPETARMHYVITDGGDAPNVVPALARVWMFTRGKDWDEEEAVYQHVQKIVEGADLMAWGEEHGRAESGFRPAEIRMLTGLYHYNPNEALARAMHANLELVGVAKHDAAEQEFARNLQRAFGVEPAGYSESVRPFDPHAAPEPGGSTDVANVSWVCPTIDLDVGNWPLEVPAHSWASTAASGTSAGLAAMHVAAKVLACAALDVLTDPKLVEAARAEFAKSVEGRPYVSPVGPDDAPALPSSLAGDRP